MAPRKRSPSAPTPTKKAKGITNDPKILPEVYDPPLRSHYEHAQNPTISNLICQIEYPCYNDSMSPRHFHHAQNPRVRTEHSVGLSNTFVAFTHLVGLGKYFSFTPDNFHYDPSDKPAKKAGDQVNPDTN